MKSPHGTKSKQDWCTPRWFIEIVEKRFGPLALDACATDADVSCGREYISPEQDGLAQSWRRGGLAWCNPPFASAEPWIKKALCEARYGDVSTLMLLPLSPEVGWWLRWYQDAHKIWVVFPRLSYYDPVAQRLTPGVSKPSCLWEIRPWGLDRRNMPGVLEMNYLEARKPRGAVR